MNNLTHLNPSITAPLLFEHFATLVTAPDGIIRLRELILQLAVQGKLGTQDPGDEPASKLLEKIQKEKTRLIKNGDIKRTDQFLPVDPEECQYEIPDGWEWTRLGTLVADSKQDIVDGPFGSDLHSAEYVDSGVPVIRLQNVQRNQFLNKNIRFLTTDKAEYLSRHNFVSGDIVITKLGEPVGKACIVPEFLKYGIFVADIIRIRLDSRFLDTNYITFMINSPFISVKFNGLVKGITRARVNLTKVREMVIPLPPLAEQHRIVTKVDRLMALCDELEARQQQERAGCLRLGTASLTALQNAGSPEEFERQWAQVCEGFELVFDCPENVGTLRQTILQLAVQGRLVRQEPGDEPAGILLEKIRAEKDRLIKGGKLQTEKPLKLQNRHDFPFNIPKNWEWTFFGQITFNRDGERIPVEKAERATRHGSYDYYGASGVIDTIDDYLFDKSLLLIGEDGANLVNRSTPIAFIAHGKYWVNNHAHVIDGISFEFLRYLEIYINAIDLIPYLTGMAQPKMNQAKMNSIPVPLPPLAEQHRIVARVDALMALCDELEARLKERAGVQERFAAAVGKQVAGNN